MDFHLLLSLFKIFEMFSSFVASGLRTPMAVPCPYPTPFGIVPHAGMNGELTSPGAAYAGLHNISPQMSAAAAAAAAAAAYGRSPVVRFCSCSICVYGDGGGEGGSVLRWILIVLLNPFNKWPGSSSYTWLLCGICELV